MELSARVVYLVAFGFHIQAVLIVACDLGQATGCQHIQEVSSLMSSLVPIPDPNSLDDTCRVLLSGLACVLGPSAMGTCTEADRAPYVAMSKALEFPCFRAKTEYFDARTCWKSANFTSMINECYSGNKRALTSNFCGGAMLFKDCLLQNTLSVPGCDVKSQRLFDIILSTWYNSIGLAFTPACPETEVPSLITQKTTASTTTTESTTVTTISPVSTDSADQVASRSTYNWQSAEQGKSTPSGDLQSVEYGKIPGKAGISVLLTITSPFDVFVIVAATVLVQFFNQNIIFK